MSKRTSEYIANAIWHHRNTPGHVISFGTLMAWMKSFRALEEEVRRLQQERDQLHDALCDERMKKLSPTQP